MDTNAESSATVGTEGDAMASPSTGAGAGVGVGVRVGVGAVGNTPVVDHDAEDGTSGGGPSGDEGDGSTLDLVEWLGCSCNRARGTSSLKPQASSLKPQASSLVFSFSSCAHYLALPLRRHRRRRLFLSTVAAADIAATVIAVTMHAPWSWPRPTIHPPRPAHLGLVSGLL